MESDSKKRKISEENYGRDRLSELPDQLLVHILSFLPTLDAVRTVLLRRFGYLWTMIPSLEFCDDTILWAKRLYKVGNQDEISPSKIVASFTSFVRNVLLLHKRPTIDKFDLSVFDLESLGDNWRRYRPFLDEIKMWITFAVQKEVKVLDLGFSSDVEVDGSVLPSCVFTCRFLVELTLLGVRINHLSRVHLPALKALWLTRFEMSNELFKKLISGCPSLEVLGIQDQRELDELRFSAPNIEELHLDVNDPCLVDCPNVKTLDMGLYDRLSPPDVVDLSSLREVIVYPLLTGDQINELVKMFYKVEVFKLTPGLIEPLRFKDIDLPRTRWKHLHIESRLHNEEELLSICRLLRISSHLEELELYERYATSGHEDCIKLSIPQLFVMPQLKIVTLRGYKVSCQCLNQVVEFLLKSASALEKMVIIPNPKKYELSAVDEAEFVKNLLSFSRASTIARVVFRSKVY